MVTKCLNARPKTKEKGISIILMYIEVEKQDVVQVGGNCAVNEVRQSVFLYLSKIENNSIQDSLWSFD